MFSYCRINIFCPRLPSSVSNLLWMDWRQIFSSWNCFRLYINSRVCESWNVQMLVQLDKITRWINKWERNQSVGVWRVCVAIPPCCCVSSLVLGLTKTKSSHLSIYFHKSNKLKPKMSTISSRVSVPNLRRLSSRKVHSIFPTQSTVCRHNTFKSRKLFCYPFPNGNGRSSRPAEFPSPSL